VGGAVVVVVLVVYVFVESPFGVEGLVVVLVVS